MKQHTVSVGYYSVYNINIEAETPEEAERKIEEIYKNAGLGALINMGKLMPPCGEEDVLIQYEGEI